MISEIVCAMSVTCALAGEVDLPFRYIGKPYDTSRSCYIQGEFHRRCPGPPPFEHYQLMTKDEYKKELLDYVAKQIDKLTVKQIRVLISSYARG